MEPSLTLGKVIEMLRKHYGQPALLPTAELAALERVTARGILKDTSAVKLRECATLAVEEFGGGAGAAIRGPLAAAKRALRPFSGIGEPGDEPLDREQRIKRIQDLLEHVQRRLIEVESW